jgi:outer membrane protein assembly factor BamB
LTQWSRVLGAVVGLLLLGVVLSGCGSTPVAENWPGLTLDGDTVYVISGSPQQVYMLDAETLVQMGTFMPQGEHKGVLYWSPVTVGGDVAFVGFAEPQAKIAGLYAFDPETGLELWHVPADDFILPAPNYADGVVYFGDSGGRVYAVDVETQGIKPGWPFEAESAIWASPLVADGRVYVAAMDHHLYCLDAETGQEIWKTELGGAMAAPPSLEAARGILYVGAYDGKEYAIRAASGEIVEGFDFQAENWIWSKPLLADDQVYVTALDGKLYALDPVTGSVISPYPFDSGEIADTNEVLRADPVQAGEFIIVATESGRVIAVKDAQRRWVWPSGTPQARVLTTPVVSQGTIYVVLMDGQVQILDAESGAPGPAFTPPESD